MRKGGTQREALAGPQTVDEDTGKKKKRRCRFLYVKGRGKNEEKTIFGGRKSNKLPSMSTELNSGKRLLPRRQGTGDILGIV